jgi:hypothetical protein
MRPGAPPAALAALPNEEAPPAEPVLAAVLVALEPPAPTTML